MVEGCRMNEGVDMMRRMMDAIPMRRKGIKKKRGKERFCVLVGKFTTGKGLFFSIGLRKGSLERDLTRQPSTAASWRSRVNTTQ